MADTAKTFKDNWAERVHYSEETGAIAGQRFGGRILDDIARLKVIGISPPGFVQASITDDPSIVGKWLGMVGQLLSQGKLHDAITMGPDAKLWWALVH